jgi:predicted secreted protein
MRDRKTVLLCLATFFSLNIGLYAGDVANFVDLGFSADGRIYAFAQYCVDEDTLLPWAELCIVDVALNDFVPGGRVKYRSSRRIVAGEDGINALHELFARNKNLEGRYGVRLTARPNETSVPLFISRENGQAPAGETIEFRDFDEGISYRATLVPIIYGTGAALHSSFHINLIKNFESEAATRSTALTVGSPEVKRRAITSYTIKKVLVTPDRSSLVFVIEETLRQNSNDAPDIRYMIECHGHL